MNTEKIQDLKNMLDRAILLMDEYQLENANPATVNEKKQSEINLNHYLKFRQLDASDLQNHLGEFGLSRFARAEGHIMHSFYKVQEILNALLNEPEAIISQPFPTSSEADALLSYNTQQLFGVKNKKRRIKVMVTIPTEAATDKDIIDKLVQAGMDCARINCAHDTEKEWLLMIQNIKESASQYQREVKIAMDLAGPKIRTSDIQQQDVKGNPYLIVKQGDIITLHDQGSGKVDHRATEQEVDMPASLSSTYPGLPSIVQIGERIFFDDGKIEGEIMSQKDQEVTILITKSKPGGAKLKPDKGINIPDTTRHISGLTEKDKSDFTFIAQHADIANFSFVNSPKDLEELFSLIDTYDAHHLGIILKIETKRAYNNLYSLLKTTLSRKNPTGVMIARGDLAIEAGWENIGYVQSEILRICAAAHLPVVWATQVLENFAKNGMPSRSELSDISQSMKADCVMLNKGPYIVEALTFLDRLLIQGESFQNKNLTMLPSLKELT